MFTSLIYLQGRVGLSSLPYIGQKYNFLYIMAKYLEMNIQRCTTMGRAIIFTMYRPKKYQLSVCHDRIFRNEYLRFDVTVCYFKIFLHREIILQIGNNFGHFAGNSFSPSFMPIVRNSLPHFI